MPRRPGAGRKPRGTAAGVPFSLRLAPDLRNELERSAKKRRRALSEEIIGRLWLSLDKEREMQRDPAIRALCYLISEIANYVNVHREQRDRRGWHRDPFQFTAFKVGVTKLLDALTPSGEVRPPLVPIHEIQSLGPEDAWLINPEAAGKRAADNVFEMLHHRLTQDEMQVMVRASLRLGNRSIADHVEDLFYDMPHVRRDLGIDKPKETKQ
jgi:hypothetical protein